MAKFQFKTHVFAYAILIAFVLIVGGVTYKLIYRGVDSAGSQKQTTEHHWTSVTKLIGGTADQYFVVIESGHVTDKAAYEDAINSVCKANVCMIGFFSTRNDVPEETYSVDFYDHGGWEKRGEIAHYIGNETTAYRSLMWDCNIFPHEFLNDCLRPQQPTPEQNVLISSRQGISGLGNVRFGMSLPQVRQALGDRHDIQTLNPQGTETRYIIRTKDVFGDRVFNSFYNVVDGRFSNLYMRWSDLIPEEACLQEEQKIASSLDQLYGKADQFNYYDETKKSNKYLWRFANGAQISLDNLNTKPNDCSLDLFMSEKSDND